MRGSTAGITDGLRGISRSYYLFITFLDSLLSALVISPLVVSYWRGTWELTGYYVYPKELKKSSGVSLIVGLAGIMLFTLTQKFYRKVLNPNEHRILYYVISRGYTACFGFVCVNSWRGAWVALDAYTSTQTHSVILITCASIGILIMTKTIRNISAPPFAIVTDRYESYFDVPTHFKSSTENLWVYLLDCVFSVCVIGMLVVFVWRGCWTILDTYLYPENIVLSTWMSLGIGYTIVGITFALQPPMKYLATELSGIPRMLIVDIYLLFSFCGTVNVWRGIWKIQDLYFFPEKPELSYALSHFVPFLLLVLINSSNSILVRGVYIDGEEAGAQCVDFPCYYLRLIFQSKRKDKILREAEKKSGEKDEQRLSEGEVLIQVGVDPVDPNWKNKSINNFCSPEVNQH
ncbi:uncharacterized protein fusl isoform X1 [Halyomorpha halys]|uniref:uncharacterized protein fusl isoform X1 n=1 Tax=Halyomorpha halys TaxID=286706 RepID=UPI0006D5297F|nr:uncharacterized protein LOC106678885 isoform X1 [Halyomorpha halys]